VFAGCSSKLTEERVRNFVDAADQAFREGRAQDICSSRDRSFTLSGSAFRLAEGKVVASLAEAEAIEAERHAAGDRLRGEVFSLDAAQLCSAALEQRRQYKRSTLERSDLRISVDPSGERASVKAHYVVREPVYEQGESKLGVNDTVERQVASRQTESDEESVVARDSHGEPVFVSSQVTSKSFSIPTQRDARY
jgi:hypothetical protein